MPQPTESARAVQERTLRLVQDRRLAEYADLFADDAVFEVPFAPPGMPRRFQGKDAIRALITRPRPELEDLRWEFKDVVIHETTDPEVVVTEFRVEVAGTAASEPYEFANLSVMTVRDGRIAALRDYWNPLDRRELAAANLPQEV